MKLPRERKPELRIPLSVSAISLEPLKDASVSSQEQRRALGVDGANQRRGGGAVRIDGTGTERPQDLQEARLAGLLRGRLRIQVGRDPERLDHMAMSRPQRTGIGLLVGEDHIVVDVLHRRVQQHVQDRALGHHAALRR